MLERFNCFLFLLPFDGSVTGLQLQHTSVSLTARCTDCLSVDVFIKTALTLAKSVEKRPSAAEMFTQERTDKLLLFSINIAEVPRSESTPPGVLGTVHSQDEKEDLPEFPV